VATGFSEGVCGQRQLGWKTGILRVKDGQRASSAFRTAEPRSTVANFVQGRTAEVAAQVHEGSASADCARCMNYQAAVEVLDRR